MADPTLEQAREEVERLLAIVLGGLSNEDRTAKAVFKVNTLLSAHTRHLAQGEGLDFKAAHQNAHRRSGDSSTTAYEYFEEELDQQHRSIVGALKAQLAASEARVKELEFAPQVWWLLEVPRHTNINGIPGNNGWWYGNEPSTGCHLFSWDFQRAVKFRTKEDAELVARSTLMTHQVVATEHMNVMVAP